MANSVLERGLDRAAEESRAGWAAPTGARDGFGAPPAPPGPPSAAMGATMSLGGVTSATAVLFALLLVGGTVGWTSTESSAVEVRFPGWLFIAALGAFGLAILTSFKPNLARFTGPIYALVEGLVLGAISKVYEGQWNGIVVQAVGITAIVFATMLFLYGTRIIKVTERFRRVVIGATIAIMIFYGISMLLSIFGVEAPLIWDAGPMGIAFSLVVVGIAAFNLALDFDLVERGTKAGLPKHYEWYCAFALMVSIVWLYLEVLRLLSKLRD
jgi:uncharacterized YccA/Bax inhibitor family protein